MAVRSRHVVQGVTVGAAIATVYTVPAGRTLVIRSWAWYQSAGAVGSAIALRVAEGAGANVQIDSGTLATGTERTREFWCVLGPGGIIRAVSSQGTVVLSVFGSLLDGAPS